MENKETKKNKMKNKSKHLSSYLPYDVKIYADVKYNFHGLIRDSQIMILKGISDDMIQFEGLGGFYPIEHFKPILRPLSDLTKEMAKDCRYVSVEHMIRSVELKHCPIDIWEDLLKNHYDVFGLIPAGLAIDINTLK